MSQKKKPTYQDSLARLGDKWEVEEIITADSEATTCLLYDYPRVKILESEHLNLRNW